MHTAVSSATADPATKDTLRKVYVADGAAKAQRLCITGACTYILALVSLSAALCSSACALRAADSMLLLHGAVQTGCRQSLDEALYGVLRNFRGTLWRL